MDIRQDLLACARRLLFGQRDILLAPSDVVQETLRIAHTKADIPPSPSAKRAWLVGILRNVIADGIKGSRRQKRDVRRTSGAGGEITAKLCARQTSVWLRLARAEEVNRLRRALGQLDEEVREILSLHIEQDRTFPEVGQILGITPDAARMRFERALKKVKGLMAAQSYQQHDE